MNTLRAFLFISALLVLLVLAAAVQPAIAQKAHGIQEHHQTIPAGKTCSSCHQMTYAQWKGSPHGTNDVQCTVCHGEITAHERRGHAGVERMRPLSRRAGGTTEV